MADLRLGPPADLDIGGLSFPPHTLHLLHDGNAPADGAAATTHALGYWVRLDAKGFASGGYPEGLSAVELVERLGAVTVFRDAAADRRPKGPQLIEQVVVLEWPAAFLRRTDHGPALPGQDDAERAIAVFKVRLRLDLADARRETLGLSPARILRGEVLPGWFTAHGDSTTQRGATTPLDSPFHPTALRPPSGHPDPDARLHLTHGWFDPDGEFAAVADDGAVVESVQPPRPLEVLYQRGRLGLVGILATVLIGTGFVGIDEAVRSSRPGADMSDHREQVARYLPVAVCSPDNPEFMREFRCRVQKLTESELSPREALTTACTAQVDCGGADLQARWCGLIDRSEDSWKADLLPGTDDVTQDFARLAAAQACFDTLGQPAAYAIGGESTLVDADRMLSEDEGIAAIIGLFDELEEACDGYQGLMERRVDGAIVATHVGYPYPNKPLDDIELGSQRLRLTARNVAVETWDEVDEICFDHGMRSGPEVERVASMCGAPADAEPSFANGNGWRKLGDKLAASEDSRTCADDVLTAYLRGRFGTALGRLPTSGRWACHASLSQQADKLPSQSIARGNWEVPVRIPRRYDVRGGAAEISQLGLESALLAVRGGASEEFGACWQVVTDLLADWPLVHPLYAAPDDQGWPVVPQQMCGQVCMGWYLDEPRLLDENWVAPENDVYRCVDVDCPCRSDDGTCATTSTACLDPDKLFPLLSLPWNGRTQGLPPASAGSGAWVAPEIAQVCAFHLTAQDRLSLGADPWYPGELSGPQWAGEATGLPGVTGGGDGRAPASAVGFSAPGVDTTWGETECGAVALQCFAGEALRVRRSKAQQVNRSNWERAWLVAMEDIARESGDTVAQHAPWCALVHPYLRPSAARDTLDEPCRRGVASARASVLSTITTIAAGGLPRPAEEEAP